MLNPDVFAAAPDEYRPVVMWFWNDAMDETEIRRQIDRFHSQRIYEFFIHPLSGFRESYLSDRYFELVRAAVDHAENRGMKMWIYDEYNWPSGTAGGRLLREFPQYRMTVLRHRSTRVEPGQRSAISFPGRPVAVIAVYGARSREIAGEGRFEDETGAATFIWTNPEPAACTVFVFSEDVQRGVTYTTRMSPETNWEEGYLDTLNPEAVRKYLDLTHERYYAKLGEYFGSTITGLFTDEVVLTNPFDFGDDSIPWTNGFEAVFAAANGYDLRPRLHELVIDTGAFRHTRWDYWRTITERFSDSYGRQVQAWCSEHRIRLTGHCCAEDHLIADMLQSGSTFRFMQHFHVPGIDSIFSKQSLDNENFNYAGKMLDSLAEHTGANRKLCETYTGSGWDLTLEEMKRIFNRLALLGVNLIQFMGAYYSLRGSRKWLPFGYPPSHSFQLPVWPHYGSLSDYIARVCYAGSLGEHAADIAVLVPTTTLWSEFAFRRSFHDAMIPDEGMRYGDLTIIERTVHGVVNALLQVRRDYDLLHEPSLIEAELSDGRLVFRGHAYGQLIAPSLTVLSDEVWEKLKAFMLAGGRVCFVNLLPASTPRSSGLGEQFASMTGFEPGSRNEEVRRIFRPGESGRTTVHQNGGFAHVVSNELGQRVNEAFRTALCEALAGDDPPIELTGANEYVFVRHRKQAGADLFLIVNDSPEPYIGMAMAAASGGAAVYDPVTGKKYRPVMETAENGKVCIPIRIEGWQLLILETGGEAEPDAVLPTAANPVVNRLPLSGDWAFATKDGHNYLLCPVSVRSADRDGGAGWISVEGRTFPACAGFALGADYEALFRFRVQEPMPSVMEWILDDEVGQDRRILINGQPLAPSGTGFVWDRTNLIYDLRPHVRLGANEIIVRSRIPDWGGEHAPVFGALRGNFRAEGETIAGLVPQTAAVPGSWTDQGWPYYSGTGIYRKSITIASEWLNGRTELRIGRCRDVIECRCNGQDAGASLWNPHRFDLTPYLQEGVNMIELRVSNTLANLLDTGAPSGITGEVELVRIASREVRR
jgi:hypothetical protein